MLGISLELKIIEYLSLFAASSYFFLKDIVFFRNRLNLK